MKLGSRIVLSALLVAIVAGSALGATNVRTTIRDFDRTNTLTQTPYTAVVLSGGYTPAVVAGGAMGNALKLTDGGGSESTYAAFNQTCTLASEDLFGIAPVVTLDFDFMLNGSADGMYVALLRTADVGTSGATGINSSEEAAITTAGGANLAIGFDIYNNGGSDPNNTHISLYYGSKIGDYTPSSLTVASTTFQHARITVAYRADRSGADVTVVLQKNSLGMGSTASSTPETVINNVFVSGLRPYNYRLQFGARTGGATCTCLLDNIYAVNGSSVVACGGDMRGMEGSFTLAGNGQFRTDTGGGSYQQWLNLTTTAGSQQGSGWITQKQFVRQGFTADFEWRINSQSGNGADGLCFCVHNNGLTYNPGESGGSANVVTLQFNTYGAGGTSEYLYVSSNSTQLAAVNLNSFVDFDYNPAGNQYLGRYNVHVDYRDGDLDVFLNDTLVVDSLAVSLGGAMDSDGKAYVGFSGRTGGATENHDILTLHWATLKTVGALTWDSNGTTAPMGLDGSGNWDTATANWMTVDGANVAWNNASPTNVSIGNGGTAGTITLTTGITASNITFNPISGNYTVTGDTLTLSGTPAITVDDDASTIDSSLAGTGFTKAGAGTLTLGGANTFGGNTTVSAGTLALGNNSALSSGALVNSGTVNLNGYSPSLPAISGSGTIQNAASSDSTMTINIGAATALTYGGALTTPGAGKLNLTIGTQGSGASDISLTGANTFSGTVTVNGTGDVNSRDYGILGINADAALGNATNALVLNNGGALCNMWGNGSGGGWSSHAGFTLGSGRTINLTGTVGGVIRIGYGDTMTVNSLITGAASLTHVDGGTLVLGNANTFSGKMQNNAGTLKLSHSSALQNATLATGGIVFDSAVVPHSFTFGGLEGSGSIALQDNAGTPNAVALTVGGNNGTTTFTGSLSNGGSLNKTGSGTLLLSGSGVTYTGATAINGGILALQDTTAFNSAVSVGSAGTLNVVRTALGFANRDNIAGNAITGSGTINVNNAGSGLAGGWVIANTASAMNFTGTLNVNSGVFGTDGAGGAGVIAGSATVNVAAGGVFVNHSSSSVAIGGLNGAGDVTPAQSGGGTYNLTLGAGDKSGTFSGILHGDNSTGGSDGSMEAGYLSLTKTGTGTQTLSGASTYSGNTIISGGVLKLAGTGTNTISGFGGSGSGWTKNGGATIAGDVATVTDNGSSEGRTVFMNSRLSLTNNFTASFTYQAGGNKTGDGAAFILQNDYRGPAALGAAGGGLGYTGILNSDALEFNLYTGAAGGKGVANAIGTAGTYTSASPVDLASGNPINVTVTYDQAAQTLTLAMQEQNTANTKTNVYSGINLANIMKGTSGFIGFGGGTGGATATQTFSNFLFTGGGSRSVLPPASALSLAAGATLDLNGVMQTVASLSDYSGSGGSVVNSGVPATLTVNPSSGVTTFSGVITGSGANAVSLHKMGAGTLVLTGANTFTGPAIVGERAYISTGASLILSNATGNAIQGNVQMGTGSAAPSFLAMGAANQFGPNSGIVFTNTSGNWGYVKLMGNNQTVATLQDPYGSAVIENTENDTGVSDCVLTVNNTDLSTVNGYLRNTSGGAGILGLTKTGAGTLTLSGGNIAYTGPTIASGGTLKYNPTVDLNTASINNTAAVVFLATNNNAYGVNGVLSGSGNWTVDGPGGGSVFQNRVILRGANNSSTGTINVVNSGKLWLDRNNNSIADAATVNLTTAGSQFFVYSDATPANQVDETIGGLSGIGQVYGYLGGGSVHPALAVGGANDATTFTGTIGDQNGSQLRFTKLGTGTLTLGGLNTYAGNTIVSAGTLALTATGATGGFGGNGTGWTVAHSSGYTSTMTDNVLTLNNNTGGTYNGVWNNTPLPAGAATQRWTVKFTFLNATASNTDGAAFVLQTAGTGSPGSAWYGGFNPGANFVINLYNGGAGGTKVGFNTGGAGNAPDTPGSGISMSINQPVNITLSYDGSSTVTATLTQGGSTWTQNYTANLSSAGLGSTPVYFGFVGGGGGATATMLISNFSFTRAGGYVPVASPVQVASGATLDLNGTFQTLSVLGDYAGGGGTVTNGAASSPVYLMLNANGATNFSGSIRDGGSANAISLVKAGGGTQTLSGANYHGGTTTLNSGVLQLGHANALQNSTVLVNTNNGVMFAAGIGTFNIGALSGGNNVSLLDAGSSAVTLNCGSNGASTTYSGALSNSGALTKAGSGTLTLSGGNTYAGTTAVNGGVLKIAAAGSLPGACAVNAGGTFDVNGQNINTAGKTFTIAGTGASGQIGALVNITSGAPAAVNNVTLNANATVGSPDPTHNGRLDVYGSVLNLNGYTLTTGGAGMTDIRTANSIQGGGAIVVSNGILRMESSQNWAGTFTVNSGTVIDTWNTSTIAGNVNLNGGTLQNVSGSDAQWTGTIGLLSDSYVNTTRRIDFFGTVTGAAYTLTKIGGDLLDLRGGVTSLGGLVINQGRVRLEENDGFGSWTGPVTVNTNTILSMWNSRTTAAAIILAGGTLQQEASGVGTWNGNFTLSTGSFADSGSIGLTINGNIGGGGSLTKNGTGTVTLNGNSSFSGGTILNDGLLYLGGASGHALGTGDLTIASGANGYSEGAYILTDQVSGAVHFNLAGNNYIRPNGFNWTVSGLNCTVGNPEKGVVENGGYGRNVSASGTITMNVPGGSAYTFVSTMRNADAGGGAGLLNVVKSGAGTQTLGGANCAYTGTTVVDGGLLAYVLGADLNSSSISNAASVSFYGGSSGAYAINSALRGAGTFIVDGPGGGTIYENRVVLRGSASDNSGTINVVNGGKLWFDRSGSPVGSNTLVNVGASAALFVYQNNTYTIGALTGSGTVYGGDLGSSSLVLGSVSATHSGSIQNGISGNVLSLTKSGSGTQTLGGSNSYGGTTTVSGGTLLVNGTSSGTGAVSVNAGTLGGMGSIAGAVTVNSGAHLSPGASAGTLTLAGGLTLNDGAVLDFELKDGGPSDLINITGGSVTGAATPGSVTVRLTVDGVLQQGTPYTLIDWSGRTDTSMDTTDFTVTALSPNLGIARVYVEGQKLMLGVNTSSVFFFK